jgi:hypothetical protein
MRQNILKATRNEACLLLERGDLISDRFSIPHDPLPLHARDALNDAA